MEKRHYCCPHMIKLFSSDLLWPIDTKVFILVFLALNIFWPESKAQQASLGFKIQPNNEHEIAMGEGLMAITGATIYSGDDLEKILKGTVLIKGDRIMAVGPAEEIPIPDAAEVYAADGKYLLPGLIDAHFHLDKLKGLPTEFLTKGITSLRDPGAWIHAYNEERNSGKPLPRLFLTGPHFDMAPPAHPHDALTVMDPEDAKFYVNKLADSGATAIKIYYRLSLSIMQAICEAAEARGIPVTAHLEITDARQVIAAGVSGIEHVTSFGFGLVPLHVAASYRQKLLMDNDARKNGRYEMWEGIDLEDPALTVLFKELVEKGVYFCPTLAVFEKQLPEGTPSEVAGFKKMLSFTKLAFESGVKIAVGSHSYVPFAQLGWAYHRELELLKACGMDSRAILKAATIHNAGFFRVEEQIGSLEAGKKADFLLLDQDPMGNITNMRGIHKVMLNGVWVENNEER